MHFLTCRAAFRRLLAHALLSRMIAMRILNPHLSRSPSRDPSPSPEISPEIRAPGRPRPFLFRASAVRGGAFECHLHPTLRLHPTPRLHPTLRLSRQ